MQVETTSLAGVLLVRDRRFGDERGWFAETYSQARYAEAGIAVPFVQDNQAFSQAPGVLRGLHFQRPPRAQDKLVRVLRGAILDVVVDIRRGSPTFGRHLAVELSAGSALQLFVPKGFAHGYCTLLPDTEVFYKVSDFYAPEQEGGLLWNDPALGIVWPAVAEQAVVVPRDAAWPTLAELDSPFQFES